MQSKQLLAERQIFEDEILSGTERTPKPSQEMPEQNEYGRNHGLNVIETRRIKLVSNSVILRVYEVLTRDKGTQAAGRRYVSKTAFVIKRR